MTKLFHSSQKKSHYQILSEHWSHQKLSMRWYCTAFMSIQTQIKCFAWKPTNTDEITLSVHISHWLFNRPDGCDELPLSLMQCQVTSQESVKVLRCTLEVRTSHSLRAHANMFRAFRHYFSRYVGWKQFLWMRFVSWCIYVWKWRLVLWLIWMWMRAAGRLIAVRVNMVVLLCGLYFSFSRNRSVMGVGDGDWFCVRACVYACMQRMALVRQQHVVIRVSRVLPWWPYFQA